jgi:hypothetical protein
MPPNEKLYVVTRGDLSPGAKIAQSVHGFREFIKVHPDVEQEWYQASNYVACLEVDDERALKSLREQAACAGVRFAEFQEPDFGDALTALVLEPGNASRKLVKHLPLAASRG